MAKDCGISMEECRLFEENDRRHFMTRRFDRTPDGKKIHMQSLGALAHYDFNLAGAYSYEQALLAMRRLALSMSAIEEQYRRMVFNMVIRNQDDHVKNIAFLMDKAGNWSLSPAFDMTYSFNPEGLWTGTHQMTLNGKRKDFVLEDFKACARSAMMKRGRAERILSEVLEVTSKWPDYADQAGVPQPTARKIQNAMRLDGFP
jgi:serine/threonine-protein kinase HipA